MRDLSETLATEPGAEAVEVLKMGVAAADAASAMITLAYIVIEERERVCEMREPCRICRRCNFPRFSHCRRL